MYIPSNVSARLLISVDLCRMFQLACPFLEQISFPWSAGRCSLVAHRWSLVVDLLLNLFTRHVRGQVLESAADRVALNGALWLAMNRSLDDREGDRRSSGGCRDK